MMDETSIDPNDVPDDEAADDEDEESGGGSPDEQLAAKGAGPGIDHPAHPKNRASNPAIQAMQQAMLTQSLGQDKSLNDARQAMTKQQRDGALLASLSKSAAQMGSVGGHVADSSAVGDMAKGLDSAAQQDYGAQAAEAQKRQAMQQYLLGQMQKRDTANNALDSREGIAANAQAGLNTRADAKAKLTAELNAKRIAAGAKDAYTPLPTPDTSGNMYTINKQTGKAQKIDIGDDSFAPKGSVAGDRKTAADSQKDWEKFGTALTDGLASSRTDMGKNRTTMTAADKVLTLGEQGKTQPGGLDKRQIHELAMSVGNLVSNGTGTAQSTIEALVPHSVGTSAAAIEEWLTSEPTGTHQQAFVDRMLDTAQREKTLAQTKINGIKSDVLQTYGHLKDADPTRWQKALDYHFGPGAEFDAQGHYQAKKAAAAAPKQGGPGMAVSAPAEPLPAHPQDSAAVTWAKAHPDDPRAVKIMSLQGGQ